MSNAIGWRLKTFDVGGGASMTMEFILYSIGFGLPTVLMLFVSAVVGWIVRKEVGALVCCGIVTAILNFGAAVRDAGSNITQQQSAVAAGSSIISTALIFALVYKGWQALRDEAPKEPKTVLILGALALITGGAAGSMAGALFLTGRPMWNDATASLGIYTLLFGGLAAVASGWEEAKSKAANTESAAADAIDQ